MYRIPRILTSDEILDKAFRRASKVQVEAKGRKARHKKLAIAKIRKASNTISSTLRKYVKAFPNFEAMSPFYYELFDVSIGIDPLRKSLGAVDWCGKKVRDIADETVENIFRSKGRSGVNGLREAAYGRFSSLMNRISKDLAILDDAREYLRRAPVIDIDRFTIVIGGAPNVGKSLLVTRISSGKPKIASYPFTTKGISVGHFESKGIKVQVIDTPGLLDREMEKRNEMEIKAVLALRHLADVIVFVMDPTGYCGYGTDTQLNILSDIKETFPDVVIIEIENKVDIMRSDSERSKISALNGEGIEGLKEVLLSLVGNRGS